MSRAAEGELPLQTQFYLVELVVLVSNEGKKK
jgi:hypothetical protein